MDGNSEPSRSLSRDESSAALTESKPADISGTSAETCVAASSQAVATRVVTKFYEDLTGPDVCVNADKAFALPVCSTDPHA